MNLDQWLDMVNFGLVVLIWLVQLIIYPSLTHVAEAAFGTWHRRYMLLISIIVGPLMAAQLALAAAVFLTARDIPALLILGGVCIVWLSSLLLSVPCHRSLRRRGKDRAVINRLVRTNWIRTVLWSGIFLLGLSR
ncbi:MAG TPA: hypothetical protein ENN06_11815 [Desulfobacteraceae bacterium]|nr:hypothetical protein [Desulfobacteraceae bacterium]